MTFSIIRNIIYWFFYRVVYSAEKSEDTWNWDKNGIMNQINKEELMDKLIYELPILRDRIDMTQDEINEIARDFVKHILRWKQGKAKGRGVTSWYYYLFFILIRSLEMK